MIHRILIRDYFKNKDIDFEESSLFKTLKLVDAFPQENAWIAGGCVRKLLMGEKLNESDIDFFFKNEHAFKKFNKKLRHHPNTRKNMSNIFVKEYEVNLLETVRESYVRASQPFHWYEQSIWNMEWTRSNEGKSTVQLIHFAYYDSVQTLLERFDFTVCQFAMDNRYLYFGSNSFGDMIFKKLQFNCTENKHSICYKRWDKYLQKGFKPTVESSATFEEIAKWVRANPRARTTAVEDYMNI